jgi:ubiquinone/menaquinone biosynthesis C-methylase UbiE
MLFNRAEMYNKRAAQPQFKAQEVIGLLKLEKGHAVADIGSGGGFFTMRFSEAVGETGKVYAVDTNEKLLAYVKKKARELGRNNVVAVAVRAGKEGLDLPSGSLDLAFMRNVFHHLEEPADYFKVLRGRMKPEGRVVIIDYKKGTAPGFIQFMRHYTDERRITEAMTKAGYELTSRYDFIPGQSFHIFRPSTQEGIQCTY